MFKRKSYLCLCHYRWCLIFSRSGQMAVYEGSLNALQKGNNIGQIGKLVERSVRYE